LAQLWRALLPVSHYINIQIHQVNYGTTFNASLSDFLSLILFISALFMANIALKKHKIKKIEAKEEIIAIEKGSN
jgi:ABC-2 type transport system permease protein